MEGAAHLQRQAAAGSGFQRQTAGFFRTFPAAADDDLAGAVIVGQINRAFLRGFPAHFFQRVPVQIQYGIHGAFHAPGGFFHGLAPESGQGDGLPGSKDPGGLEGGIFAQTQSGGGLRDDAPFFPKGSDSGGKGHHAGLGVPGLGQLLLRSFKTQFFQIKIHRRIVQDLAEQGIGLIEILPHSGVLAALPSV